MTYPYSRGGIRPGRRGFTLLELIVVLFIVALAAGLVGSVVGSSREKEELRQEALRLYGTLRHIRERALMERIPYALTVDRENARTSVLKNGAPAGPPHSLPPGIAISGGPVLFFPKGDAKGEGIAIKDKNGRGFSIDVDLVTGTATLRRL